MVGKKTARRRCEGRCRYDNIHFKLCHHELLKAEKSISTHNHAQRVTVSPLEEEEEEEGKNKSEYKMKNDSMLSFCDSSHLVADPTPGLNQRLQPKISTVVTKKKNLSHQCSVTVVNKEGDEERKGRCRVWWNGKDSWVEFHPWCCGTAVNIGGRQDMTMGKGKWQWQRVSYWEALKWWKKNKMANSWKSLERLVVATVSRSKVRRSKHTLLLPLQQTTDFTASLIHIVPNAFLRIGSST